MKVVTKGKVLRDNGYVQNSYQKKKNLKIVN